MVNIYLFTYNFQCKLSKSEENTDVFMMLFDDLPMKACIIKFNSSNL